MATTQLFVELLVIGIGALFWLVLLGAAALGYPLSNLTPTSTSSAALVPLLTISYVLGIMVDRLADRAFNFWDKKHRKRVFGDDSVAYYDARRMLAIHGRKLWELLEYGRSRMRICRGWALNFFLLAPALSINYLTGNAPPLKHSELWPIVGLLLILSALCCYCWRELNCKEYSKIDRQAPWIERLMNSERR